MAFKYENYFGGTPSTWSIPAVNGVSDGDLSFQTFTPQVTHEIETVFLYLRKIADSPTVNFIIIQIQPTNGNGRPSGSGAGTAIINVLIPSGSIEQTAYDWKWVQFDLGAVASLTAGIVYAIEMYYQPNSGTYPIHWAKKTPDTNYPRGQIWHWVWNGNPYPGDWLDGTGEGDHYFQEWGIGARPPPDPLPSYPADRPGAYDPDLIWVPGEWTDPNTYVSPEWGEPSRYFATGGGQWGQQLVVVGNGKVYYSELD